MIRRSILCVNFSEVLDDSRGDFKKLKIRRYL